MKHRGLLVAGLATGAALTVGIAPAQASALATPDWMPQLATQDVVVVTPGTGDFAGADQLGRTRDIGLFGTDPAQQPSVRIVSYPAAFGFTVGGVLIPIVGTGTFNDSTTIGTAKAVAAAEAAHAANPGATIVLNGYSQSAPVAMNAAYVLHQRGDDDGLAVVVGADSRFPHSGVENVFPSFLPGLYTNGDRNPADLGDVPVYSYCVRGDATCGLGNPLADPIGTVFYVLPGFYLHANMNDDLNDFAVVDTWSSQDPVRGCGCGNTTYVVYDGGNPWAMMLRDVGVPVPREVDQVINTLVPVPKPGVQSTLAGHAIRTPRELQDTLAGVLGRPPTTDPDRNPGVRDQLVADHTPDDSTPAPAAAAPAPALPTSIVQRVSAAAPESGQPLHPGARQARADVRHTVQQARADVRHAVQQARADVRHAVQRLHSKTRSDVQRRPFHSR